MGRKCIREKERESLWVHWERKAVYVGEKDNNYVGEKRTEKCSSGWKRLRGGEGRVEGEVCVMEESVWEGEMSL